MALEEELVQDSQQELSSEEERELDIMVALAKNLIDDEGYNIIDQASQSSDPGTIIGQFLMQLGAQLGEQLPFEISPRIMLSHGGWVEQVSDYLQEEYDVPKKVMDRAEIFVGSSSQQMAQGAQAQQAAPQEAPVAPAAPLPQEQMNG